MLHLDAGVCMGTQAEREMIDYILPYATILPSGVGLVRSIDVPTLGVEKCSLDEK